MFSFSRAQIGATLGPFQLALLPIGTYSPRWFMSAHHLNPLDAITVHRQLRARRSVAMMWGTFRLVCEQGSTGLHSCNFSQFVILKMIVLSFYD